MLFFIVERRGITLSIINITEPNLDHNDNHIKLVKYTKTSGTLIEWFKKLENPKN